MCKFIHFRNAIEEGLGADVRGDGVATKGGRTVAFEEGENRVIKYAVAYCSPRDNYCRKTGRAIAAGRLKAGKTEEVTLSQGESVYDVFA